MFRKYPREARGSSARDTSRLARTGKSHAQSQDDFRLRFVARLRASAIDELRSGHLRQRAGYQLHQNIRVHRLDQVCIEPGFGSAALVCRLAPAGDDGKSFRLFLHVFHRRLRACGRRDASITRLVVAMMLEQTDEWSLNRRYMQLDGLQTVSDTVPTRLSAVARLAAHLSPSGLWTYTMALGHDPPKAGFPRSTE